MRRKFAIFALGLAAACASEPETYDLTPFQVAEVVPEAGALGVADMASAQVTFNRAVNPDLVAPTHFVLARSRDVDEAFLSDLKSNGLTTSRLEKVAPVELELHAGGAIVRLTPTEPLERGAEYFLLVSGAVRDGNRNALVVEGTKGANFQSRFTIEANGPVASLVRPTPGAERVPRNLGTVEVSFSVPVSGVSASSFLLEEASGSRVAGQVSLAQDGRSATFGIPGDLQANQTYAVTLTEEITGADGIALSPQRWSFTTGACADLTAPLVTDVKVEPWDTRITVSWTTDEPVGSQVRLQARGDCPGLPATFTGELSRCLGPYDACSGTPAVCTSVVTISGLCAATSYDLIPVSTDFAANEWSGATVQASTLPPQPNPVISEVLVDPSEDQAGEFIEVINNSAVPWTPQGWTMSKVLGGGPTTKTLMRADGLDVPLPSGGIALYVVSSYDVLQAGGAVVLWAQEGESKLLSTGLSNTEPPRLELRAPPNESGQQTLVSTFPSGVKCGKGKSAERFSLSGGDTAENIGCLVDPTPGRAPPEG